jgi:hypothetical protein
MSIEFFFAQVRDPSSNDRLIASLQALRRPETLVYCADPGTRYTWIFWN